MKMKMMTQMIEIVINCSFELVKQYDVAPDEETITHPSFETSIAPLARFTSDLATAQPSGRVKA